MHNLNEQRQIAKALLEIGAVQFKPQDPIRFKSGILSPIYVDNRRLVFHPQQWHLVIEAFSGLIEREILSYDVLAGVALGGVPHSSALAYRLEKPSVFIRKAGKEHGTRQQVEGGDVNDLQVLLIEDLVTTGGSSLEAIQNLIGAGAVVNDVLAIVSYEFEAAIRAFRKADIRLFTLTHFNAIMAVTHEMNLYQEDEIAIIEDWFNDPTNWGERQGFE